MLTYETIKTQLIDEESIRFKPYKDSEGNYTIGIGHLIVPKDLEQLLHRPYSVSMTITEAECDLLLKHDLEIVYKNVKDHFPWYNSIPDYQQYVLVNLIFNMGINKFLKFKNTLKAWEQQNIQGVINGLRNSLWYKQVGKRGPKLIGILNNKRI